MKRSGNLEIRNDYLIYELLEDADYDVRNDGTVWTLITQTGKRSVKGVWRLAGTDSKQHGYRIMKYKNRNLNVHRIIYAKFIGLLSSDLVINHIDNNKLNNLPSNLELVTQLENNLHTFREGGKSPSHKKPGKFSQEVINQIHDIKSSGATRQTLSKLFSLKPTSIDYVLSKYSPTPNQEEFQEQEA